MPCFPAKRACTLNRKPHELHTTGINIQGPLADQSATDISSQKVGPTGTGPVGEFGEFQTANEDSEGRKPDDSNNVSANPHIISAKVEIVHVTGDVQRVAAVAGSYGSNGMPNVSATARLVTLPSNILTASAKPASAALAA